ncbi:hypothetical protein [Cupriavidus sp. MP-37]|uniref:hypothetical protein n=1 Tax=Cupriavidus sp. MP-37 TaxID=2884455 RepID=UPI00351D62D2
MLHVGRLNTIGHRKLCEVGMAKPGQTSPVAAPLAPLDVVHSTESNAALQIYVSGQQILIHKPNFNGIGHPDMFRIASREWSVNYAYNPWVWRKPD